MVAVVGPVRAVIGIISRNAQLQRRNARQVFIIWEHDIHDNVNNLKR